MELKQNICVMLMVNSIQDLGWFRLFKRPAQKLPAQAYFGYLVILLSKLYYKNILSLKM